MTIQEARKLAKKLMKKDSNYPEMRSCWKCNGAHEHLKSHTLIWCFECGHFYYKGLDITEK